MIKKNEEIAKVIIGNIAVYYKNYKISKSKNKFIVNFYNSKHEKLKLVIKEDPNQQLKFSTFSDSEILKGFSLKMIEKLEKLIKEHKLS